MHNPPIVQVAQRNELLSGPVNTHLPLILLGNLKSSYNRTLTALWLSDYTGVV
ncbi:hypothetical protein OF830_00920 [Bacillus paramycoides]|uniref:hypothetical protein n=1 Tax=Bacillus paramycoides TaxID=2026194 RepID=UPI002244DB2D|nr:hypothetical protein [Bacillus paramycoides]MCW9129553.1 hypothetical protein [Bacillus paramycoides]